MKNAIIAGVMAVTIMIAGCGKKSLSSSATPPTAQADATSSSSPVLQPALTAWRQDDKPAAVSSFLAADWSARPLFSTGSPLSLTENQFKTLTDADRKARSDEMLAQLHSLKELTYAVVAAGRDAAAKGDIAHARKCFVSLTQCGAALNSPDYSVLVQRVGLAIMKMPEKDLAQIGQ